MKVMINGESRTVGDQSTLHDLLTELKLDGKPIAVERNRQVIPRTQYATTRLAESDKIEVVHAVGGG